MTAPNLTQRDKEYLTAGAVLCTLVLVFGGAELVTRWQQFSRFGLTTVEASDNYYTDAKTGLRLPAPNSRHGRIVINEQGFRGKVVATPKPPGTIRLLFIGSSSTFGPYIGDADATWPYVAVTVLQQYFPDCHFDVVNAGVAGMSTRHLETYFDKIATTVEPDLTVIKTSDMNVRLNAVARRNGLLGDSHFEPSLFGHYSLFWRKVEKNARIISLRRAANRDEGKLNIAPELITDDFERELRQVLAVVKAGGSQPVLVANSHRLRREQTSEQRLKALKTSLFYMPYMNIDGMLRMTEAYRRSISKVAVQNDIPFIDPNSQVAGNDANFVDSNHFTPAGAKLAGHAVGRALAGDDAVLAVIRSAGRRCAKPVDTNS